MFYLLIIIILSTKNVRKVCNRIIANYNINRKIWTQVSYKNRQVKSEDKKNVNIEKEFFEVGVLRDHLQIITMHVVFLL